MVFDKGSKLTKESAEFLDFFELKNCVVAPVMTRGQSIGVLCLGNAVTDYEFKKDSIELLKLFTWQIAIAVENERLTNKANELSIKDDLTGLYNERYITGRLDEEIKRAILYQRPCSFVILAIDDFILFRQDKGELTAEETIKKIGKAIEANIAETDRVGRFSVDEFAIVMPEKNKKQAKALGEVLRQNVEALGIKTGGNYPRNIITVSGGVSENPLDGATSGQLLKKARASLDKANAGGKNVIIS
jgi:diguanylate cyclase (GGDEF)-like protein